MHRFRKRSDVKRSHAPASPSQDVDAPQDFLPPVSDFRTSLILPDLSRRFSLLRTPTGEPVTVDHLRSKLSQHRTQGSQHSITEEEQEMILESLTLGRLRGRSSSGTYTPEQSQENIDGNDGGLGEDESGNNSSTTITLSKGVTSSPGGRSAKRYSNNMFGSGRLRDYSYLRSVASSRTSAAGASSKTLSLTPSEASSSAPHGNTSSIGDSLRPSTPTSTSIDELLQSTSSIDLGSVRSSVSPYLDQSQPISAAEYRLQKSLSPATLKRASLALESAIKEIEDDIEEEIVMPRSTPIPRNHIDHQHPVAPHQAQRQLSEISTRDTVASVLVEAGMAISSDKPADPSDAHAHRGPSPVPLNATPGYIPGMPRPMTPRDFEFFADEQRSHSTTPRATSPMHNSFTMSESATASVSISKILRRDSTSSTAARQSPRPTTPFLQRSAYGSISASSTNGRQTPVDDKIRHNGDASVSGTNGEHSFCENEQSIGSSILGGKKRPASPLANPPFQSITASNSASAGLSISRPTTPSKIVWAVNSGDPGANKLFPSSPGSGGHSRDNSWTSDSGRSDSDVYSFINAATKGNDVFGHVGVGVGEPERKQRSGSGTHGNGVVAPGLQSSGSHSSNDEISQYWASNRAVGNGRASSPLNEPSVSQHSFSDASASLEDGNGRHNRNHRSSTPTQHAQRSGTSPTVSGYQNTSPRAVRRSSRQSPPTSVSPFDLGPLPSLMMNCRANLSTSSFHSTGSSFHSLEDNDKTFNIFDEIDAHPAWHDLSTPSSGRGTRSGSETRDKASSSSETSPGDDWEPDEIVRSYAGLKKVDFALIQEKLVAVARTTEHRGSALRKRRPSTSQSNYSMRDHRVASPPPPSSPVAVHSMAREQQKAVIAEQQNAISAPGMSLSASTSSVESGIRRNLSQVLFGEREEPVETVVISPVAEPVAANPNVSVPSELIVGPEIAESSISELLESAMGQASDTHASSTTSKTEEPPAPSTYLLNRNLSTIRIPQSPQQQAALTLEVQQKVQAATLALRKPSNDEGPAHLSRKRIDPSQISGPTLVSASTSVDTIPLKTPSLTAASGSGGSKIGSRFKRLRGSIRGKAATTIDENASITSDTKISPGAQTANYDTDKSKANSGPNSSSLLDSGRYKVAVPSPPASAGPGLKGFMARFRAKRMTDIPQSLSSSTQGSPQISAAPFSPMSPLSKHFPETPTPTAAQFAVGYPKPDHEYVVPSPQQTEHRALPSYTISRPSRQNTQQNETAHDPKEGGGDVDALQQLFAAANRIGIDQTALNDLLVRSGSLNSKTLLSNAGVGSNSGSSRAERHTSLGDSRLAVPSLQPNLSSSSGSDHTATPGMFASSISSGTASYGEETAREDEGLERRPSAKQPEHLRRPGGGAPVNSIVRRTIIFVDPRQSTVDPGMLRRASTKRRRTSVQSVSNRSVHDRVPTPPPSKAPFGKRFSHEGSPPVPQLPQSFGGHGDTMLSIPSVGTDKAHSAAYDSLYELYGESRAPSMMVDPNNHDNRGEQPNNSDSSTGVEVIELANGETIWKIVNGLRDGDDESVYTGRNSVSSEYSTREGGEGMQVFVKEHIHTGSNGSYLSRKKASGGKPRPETKIMYSSPEHVAHLIEQLSHGMDAGSFNFMPYRDSGSGSASGARSSVEPGHSATSSLSANEINWTMKEIDHMLTNMSPRDRPNQ